MSLPNVRPILQHLRAAQWSRFAIQSGMSFLLTLSVSAGSHRLFGVREEFAVALAFATALVVNFLAFRHFVYQSASRSAGRQFGAFLASSLMFRGLEYLAFLALHRAGVNFIAAMVVVQGCGFVTKYVYYGRLIFSREAARP